MIVTNVGRDAVDADVLGARERADERRICVRRSRVVPAPRCWRQALRVIPRGDGGKKAGHQEEHAISRKTIAQGRPECFR